MKNQDRIWTGKGPFPPGGWEGSPHRSFHDELKDGFTLDADFWREIAHISWEPLGKRPITCGASLRGTKGVITATIWLADQIQALESELFQEVVTRINSCFAKAGYAPKVVGKQRRRTKQGE